MARPSWLWLILFSLTLTVSADNLRPEELYQKVLPSVLTLHVENALGQTFVGTAFLAVNQDIAVTAWHVISDATHVSAKFSDDQVVEIDGILDKDEVHDLALVHLKGGGRPLASLCLSNPLVGSRVYVIGAPKGYDFSIADGLISQIQKIHGYGQFQVSCPISGGNSGGPVLNERGEVIGVAAWTKKDAQNLNFAIPIEFVTHLQAAHPLIAWNTLAKMHSDSVLPEALTPAAAAVKSADADEKISDFKKLLKESAGKKITVTVNEGDNEKKFELVLPHNFLK